MTAHYTIQIAIYSTLFTSAGLLVRAVLDRVGQRENKHD
jgi:hypothetical protein